MHRANKVSLYAPLLTLSVILLLWASRLIPEDTFGMDGNPYLSVVVLQLLIYAVPTLFYTRLRGRELTSQMQMRLPRAGHGLYILYSTVFLITGVALLSVLMYTVSPEAFRQSAVTTSAAFAMNDRLFDVLYLVIAVAILPAITEEILFRGAVLTEYKSYGATPAVIMSALTFAMSHLSLERFPIYFYSGIVLAAAALTTRSVFATVMIHTVNNAMVLLSERYVLYITDRGNISSGLFLLIVGALFLISGMLSAFEAQHIYKSYARDNVPSEYSKKQKSTVLCVAETFFAPLFLLTAVVFLALTLL